MRRIVTVYSDAENQQVGISEREVSPIPWSFAAGERYILWGSSEAEVRDEATELSALVPSSDEARVLLVEFLPGHGLEALPAPGTTGSKPSSPGFHSTPTLDIVYVTAGSLGMETPDGAVVRMRAGDSLIQRGTPHRWFNDSEESCWILGIMLGDDFRDSHSGIAGR